MTSRFSPADWPPTTNILTDARNRARIGLAARNEVLAVEVERDRARLADLRAATDTRVAEADLRRLLDAPPETVLKPSDTLGPVSAESDTGRTVVPGAPGQSKPDVGTTGALPAPGAAEPGGKTAAPGAEALADLARSALASRPDRAALALRADAAKAQVQVEEGAHWPQLSASAGYDYSNPNRRYFPPEAKWRDSWDASVNLSVTLFDGGRISSSVDRARAQARALTAALADLDGRIRVEVVSRALDLSTAEASLDVAETALRSARENRQVSQDRYRDGVGTSTDLLDAENALLQAGLEETQARAGVRLAQAALDRAIGRIAP